jgi:type IV pilus assembly protein PilC
MAPETVQTTYPSQGTDKSGAKTKREIQGSYQAPVKAQLRNQGFAPTKFKRKSKDLFGPKRQKIKPGNIAVSTRQLTTSMKLSIQLVQSLEIAGQTLENSSMRELDGQIRDDVGAGNTFAGFIRKHPRYFQL